MKINMSLTRPTRLLIGANVVLAMIVTAELLLPAQPGAANAAAAGDAEATLPEFGDTTIAAPPVSQLANMVERPLFYIDRRMPEPEVASAAAPIPLELTLEGIAIAGGARVAVLRNLNGNSLVQLAVGDLHDGWTLDALTATSATFSRNGGQSTELLLDPVGNGRRR
jgi:general secretion pathway protein N